MWSTLCQKVGWGTPFQSIEDFSKKSTPTDVGVLRSLPYMEPRVRVNFYKKNASLGVRT